jgi:hypothetical protein
MDVTWMAQANCLGLEMHPEDDDDGGTLGLRRRVCGPCTVRQPCLEYALADPSLQGIWGGSTVGGRIDMRRRLRLEVAA